MAARSCQKFWSYLRNLLQLGWCLQKLDAAENCHEAIKFLRDEGFLEGEIENMTIQDIAATIEEVRKHLVSVVSMQQNYMNTGASAILGICVLDIWHTRSVINAYENLHDKNVRFYEDVIAKKDTLELLDLLENYNERDPALVSRLESAIVRTCLKGGELSKMQGTMESERKHKVVMGAISAIVTGSVAYFGIWGWPYISTAQKYVTGGLIGFGIAITAENYFEYCSLDKLLMQIGEDLNMVHHMRSALFNKKYELEDIGHNTDLRWHIKLYLENK